jgi:hypothetical protein
MECRKVEMLPEWEKLLEAGYLKMRIVREQRALWSKVVGTGEVSRIHDTRRKGDAGVHVQI